MKKNILTILIVSILLVTGCENKTEQLENKINELESQINDMSTSTTISTTTTESTTTSKKTTSTIKKSTNTTTISTTNSTTTTKKTCTYDTWIYWTDEDGKKHSGREVCENAKTRNECKYYDGNGKIIPKPEKFKIGPHPINSCPWEF